MFKSSYEQDLFDAYSERESQPMNFRMGYNRISNERIHIRCRVVHQSMNRHFRSDLEAEKVFVGKYQ